MLDLTPYLLRWYVQIYPRIIMSKSHENILLTIFKNFSQQVNNPKWPLDDLWPHICWCLMYDSTLEVDTVTIFQKINQKVNDPKMTFDSTTVDVTSVTLTKNHWVCSNVS